MVAGISDPFGLYLNKNKKKKERKKERKKEELTCFVRLRQVLKAGLRPG